MPPVVRESTANWWGKAGFWLAVCGASLTPVSVAISYGRMSEKLDTVIKAHSDDSQRIRELEKDVTRLKLKAGISFVPDPTIVIAAD